MGRVVGLWLGRGDTRTEGIGVLDVVGREVWGNLMLKIERAAKKMAGRVNARSVMS